jgi:hypothetical protein
VEIVELQGREVLLLRLAELAAAAGEGARHQR